MSESKMVAYWSGFLTASATVCFGIAMCMPVTFGRIYFSLIGIVAGLMAVGCYRKARGTP